MSTAIYKVTKTYGHNLGLSACFRQWRAESHCAQLHGYALEVELEFECQYLNGNNWVIDFGGLKPVKAFLQETFDHKLLVAQDDPALDDLCMLGEQGLADVVVLPSVGCEAFAAYIFDWVETWMKDSLPDYIPSEVISTIKHNPRALYLNRVTVREHGANAASFERAKL